MGRPKSWDLDDPAVLDKVVQQVRDLTYGGASRGQLAASLGISVSTLGEYRRKYPAIQTAIEEGEDERLDRIEIALQDEATGYDYTETRVTNKGTVVEVKCHARANVVAGFFILQNRRPEKWKNVKSVEVTGRDGGPLAFSVVDVVRIAAAPSAEPSAESTPEPEPEAEAGE